MIEQTSITYSTVSFDQFWTRSESLITSMCPNYGDKSHKISPFFIYTFFWFKVNCKMSRGKVKKDNISEKDQYENSLAL